MSKARLKLLKREVKELRRARSDQLLRDGVAVARRTVGRLMAAMGLAGVRRGKTTITTVSNPKAPCPLDRRLFSLQTRQERLPRR